MWLAANAHGVAAPILRLQRQGTPITLVGVMHYNPASCELVRSTILEEPALGAVCVELCDARFNATIASKWRRGPSFERTFFEDECQVAFEAAQDGAGLGVVLADQPIGETARRSADLLLATARDVLTPGGWRRIAADLTSGAAELLDGGGGLRPADALLNGALLRGAPLAVARYLAASPPAAILLVGALLTLDALLAAIAVDTSVIGLPERAAEIALVLVVSAAALRVVLVALVLERNDALADAIAREARGGGAVIGVLGMVHMNGVRRRLLESSADV